MRRHIPRHDCSFLQVVRRNGIFLILVNLCGHLQPEAVNAKLSGGNNVTGPAIAYMQARTLRDLTQVVLKQVLGLTAVILRRNQQLYRQSDYPL